MSLIVRVGSLVFRGRRGATRDGFYIDAEGFTGWDDGVGVRREFHEIPQGHGASDLPGYREPRVFGWPGRCYADSEGKLEWWRGALMGLLADGTSAPVVVQNRGLTTWVNARLATQPEFAKIPGGALIARYRIQFWAANPRRFGEGVRNVASGVPAVNYGNFPATPVLTVTATSPMSGYTIAGPDGKLFTVTVACNPGHPHTIDMATGLLVADGVVSVGSVSRAETWTIPAGGQVTHTLTPASGAGTLDVAVTDTYI